MRTSSLRRRPRRRKGRRSTAFGVIFRPVSSKHKAGFYATKRMDGIKMYFGDLGSRFEATVLYDLMCIKLQGHQEAERGGVGGSHRSFYF
jgi:hypothetical protein